MLPYNHDHHSYHGVAEEEAREMSNMSCPAPNSLDEAMERSRNFLLSLQHPEGFWWGELEANATITSQTVLLYKILGIDHTYPLHKMESYIRRTQRSHGGWEVFHGDGGCLSATIESYMALHLLNAPKSDPALRTGNGMEGMGIVPFRQRGLKQAEKWLLERQEDSGDFQGIFPPMFYSIVCMKVLGYELTDPILHRAILSLKVFTVETKDECYVQSAISPVWDTALTIRSLVESGMEPNHPALQRAGEWLLKKQITKHGDWSYKNPSGLSGGWAFQFSNRWYPDVDDSAAVVMALNALKLQNEDVKNSAIARCFKWISTMQCKEGRWAAYDRDCNQAWLNHTPFGGDLKAMIDPNTVDVCARVLEMVGRLKRGGSSNAADLMPPEVIARGLTYLRKEQEVEGCWYGRWGVNYIYGTCGALLALSQVAPEMHMEEIEKGARWLVEVQNNSQKVVDISHGKPGTRDAHDEEGGWGETCFSYYDDEGGAAVKGKGGSTASQTAWAVQGLLAAGDAMQGKDDQLVMELAMERGVQYLINTQRRDGSWHEPHFTGCGFPQHFYLRYHLYAQHFPLSALSRYRSRLLQLASNKINIHMTTS